MDKSASLIIFTIGKDQSYKMTQDAQLYVWSIVLVFNWWWSISIHFFHSPIMTEEALLFGYFFLFYFVMLVVEAYLRLSFFGANLFMHDRLYNKKNPFHLVIFFSLFPLILSRLDDYVLTVATIRWFFSHFEFESTWKWNTSYIFSPSKISISRKAA